uniref:serpin-ZX-like n=1 Tax=Erigeron canadensis TaxID=72917 RepID=UPI001CB95A55|nr:serpin-ZX-like [Erigeron canadensis]
MDIRQSIRNQTHVSITLANHLLLNKFQDSNVVFSPVSIHIVLGLVASGCNGQTLHQLLAFLMTNTIHDVHALYSQLVPWVFADGSPYGGPRLAFSNGAWVENTVVLKPNFKQVVETIYHSSTNQVDFKNKPDEVTKEVNLWAETQTAGLIKDILPVGAVTQDTRIIFANAIYFKGIWNEKFDPSRTKHYDFHPNNDGSRVQVPFMTSNKKQFVRSCDGFKVLGLPYLQGGDRRRFTMYIFLPDAKNGLLYLIERLGSESDFLERYLPFQKVEVGQFLIPKFKISFGFEAKDMLMELGLVLPFNAEEGLNEMVEQSNDGGLLYVSDIYHKSFVEVNEEGTEAAAVSAVVIMQQCAMIPVDFVADHPFLFMIREDMSRVVLFMGQVIDPSVE